MINILLGTLEGDVQLALTFVFFVLIMNWARSSFGPKTSLVFSAIITYLTFFQHPSLVWLALLIFIAGTGVLNAFLKSIEGIK